MSTSSSGIWIFGYGSLIWRADFPFSEKQPAFIKGWARRFWQGSTDHRGVPGAPGRVVTLVQCADAICWGMAYRIEPGVRDEVMAKLDHREKGGYDRLELPLHFKDGILNSGVTYHATVNNPNYLGQAEPKQIAQQIIESAGPSGANIDYLVNLELALNDLNMVDPHVAQIAAQVRELQQA